MSMELDCRGLACPAPVLKAKETIEAKGLSEITVLVDNKAAKENVARFLGSQGFQVVVEEDGNEFRVKGSKARGGETCQVMSAAELAGEKKRIMVMVTTDRVGHGDQELGRKLMMSFLSTLPEMGGELWRIVFLNNGVKLTVRGSEALDILKDIEAKGTQLMVCGTCLTHFGLLDQKEVGETTNMLDIVTSMLVADTIINI